jgi:hypothetical protein
MEWTSLLARAGATNMDNATTAYFMRHLRGDE